MKLPPPVRKRVLTAHVTSSVGWLSMEIVAWYVIVPCAFAALASGVVGA